MQTLKQKGFTLIELLVVIVIIGILATISVATFSGYFAKARDSERQAAVRNASTILKTARAVESIDTFATASAPAGKTAITLATVLRDEGGYTMPAANGGYTYAYAYNTAAVGNSAIGDEFFFLVCSEENAATSAWFIDGTSAAVTAANAETATDWCDLANSDTDPSDHTITNWSIAAAS